MACRVDAADDHRRWARDIEETPGRRGDRDYAGATLYGMLPADVSSDARSPSG